MARKTVLTQWQRWVSSEGTFIGEKLNFSISNFTSKNNSKVTDFFFSSMESPTLTIERKRFAGQGVGAHTQTHDHRVFVLWQRRLWWCGSLEVFLAKVGARWNSTEFSVIHWIQCADRQSAREWGTAARAAADDSTADEVYPNELHADAQSICRR